MIMPRYGRLGLTAILVLAGVALALAASPVLAASSTAVPTGPPDKADIVIKGGNYTFASGAFRISRLYLLGVDRQGGEDRLSAI